jgi:hypothetical protein
MPQCNVTEILQNVWRRSGNKFNRRRGTRGFVTDSRSVQLAFSHVAERAAQGCAALSADQKKPSFFGL